MQLSSIIGSLHVSSVQSLTLNLIQGFCFTVYGLLVCSGKQSEQ